ncbi:MAG: hypothetical protein WA809_05590, partial [Candidatus Dormiibacterota bacterium]
MQLPPGHTLGGEERQTWTLPTPVGTVELLIANETPAQLTELTFRSAGFDSEIEAEAAGSCLRDWLRLDSALEGRGLDLGTDAVVSWLGSAPMERLARQGLLAGMVLVPDVHGLTVYECEEADQPVRFAARARGTVDQKSEVLKRTLRRAARFGALTDTQALACDLLSLVHRETSGRARLL